MMPKTLSIEQHTPPVGSARREAMNSRSSVVSAPAGGEAGGCRYGHSHPPRAPMMTRWGTCRDGFVRPGDLRVVSRCARSASKDSLLSVNGRGQPGVKAESTK